MKKIILSSCIVLLFSGFVLPVNAAVDFSIETVDNFRVGDVYKKKAQLRWKKIADVKFYQIKVLREKSNGKYKTIKRIRTKKNVKKKLVKKLARSHEYYFKIRACKSKKKYGPWSEKIRTTTLSRDPILENLIVDFGAFDPVTKMAGAFDFEAGYYDGKVFYEFGAEVGDGIGGTKMLPTFEYRVTPTANVYAPVSGKILGFEYQEDTKDYEISIGETYNDQFFVSIDHITNITVGQGEIVEAGDILGNPGTWSGGLGRVELDIYGTQGHECPFNFFSNELEAEYHAKVLQHMQDWESWKHDDAIYDEESMIYAPGCAYKTLTEEQL